jgi:hypothetical protein
MSPIEAPPAQAPVPVSKFLSLDSLTQGEIMNRLRGYTGGGCDIPVRVGLFFDGTNNHMERDRNGQRVPVPLTREEKWAKQREARAAGLPVDDDPQPEPIPPISLAPEQCSHSNVARLFEAYPWDKQAQGFHPFYIQGVGTPFPEIGEPTESQGGKAFGAGGLPRIVWGLLQVLNAIHMTVYGGRPLYEDDEAGQLAQSYGNEVGRTDPSSDRQQAMTHEDWFAPHLDKLKAALKAKPKPHIPSLIVSVFGFSRGAAEIRFSRPRATTPCTALNSGCAIFMRSASGVRGARRASNSSARICCIN